MRLDDDFAAGFEDSKFDKLRPFLKALVVVILLAGAIWGAVAYFGATGIENGADKDYTPSTTAIQQTDDSDSKLSQCIKNANSKNPTSETTDPNFYPKLISGYDAQLACYDQYPDAHGANSRSSIELARDNALDSSGDYKNTYTPPSGSSGSYSSKSSITGCDYSLSESAYLACSDKYYATHGSSSSSSPSGAGGVNTPSPTPSSGKMDVAWCSAKKSEVDSLYSSYQEARTSYQNARDKVAAIDSSLRNVSTSRPPGFSGTQSQLELWRDSERRRLTSERVPLAAQLSTAEASYNTASSKYVTAQKEYINGSC